MGALLVANATLDIEVVVEGVANVLGKVDASCATKVVGTKVQVGNASIVASAKAHHAWLKGYIKRATGKSPIVQSLARFGNCHHFGMLHSVFGCVASVVGNGNNLAVFDNNGTNGHFVLACGNFCLLKCKHHKFFLFGHLHVSLLVELGICNLLVDLLEHFCINF